MRKLIGKKTRHRDHGEVVVAFGKQIGKRYWVRSYFEDGVATEGSQSHREDYLHASCPKVRGFFDPLAMNLLVLCNAYRKQGWEVM